MYGRNIVKINETVNIRRGVMRYQVGSAGRVIVARFDDGDDVLMGLKDVAIKQNLRSAVLYLVGGMKAGRFVVGPKTDEMPPDPEWRELSESHEILGIGTIFWHGDEPRIHIHGSFGKFDKTKTGCLREDATAFIVLEAIIMEIVGLTATREFDPVTRFTLLEV
jgi:predicted DNA-binding protein with PD1-like motif